MKEHLRDWAVLLIYNYITRPISNWRMRRLWITEGRDPAKYFGAGRVTTADLQWARSEIDAYLREVKPKRRKEGR